MVVHRRVPWSSRGLQCCHGGFLCLYGAPLGKQWIALDIWFGKARIRNMLSISRQRVVVLAHDFNDRGPRRSQNPVVFGIHTRSSGV